MDAELARAARSLKQSKCTRQLQQPVCATIRRVPHSRKQLRHLFISRTLNVETWSWSGRKSFMKTVSSPAMPPKVGWPFRLPELRRELAIVRCGARRSKGWIVSRVRSRGTRAVRQAVLASYYRLVGLRNRHVMFGMQERDPGAPTSYLIRQSCIPSWGGICLI